MKQFSVVCSIALTIVAVAMLTLPTTKSHAQNQAAPSSGGTLLSFGFETKAWPQHSATAVGTIDVAGSTRPSRGLRTANSVSSGPLAIRNRETNLGKLTLAFNLSVSAARPVQVLVESFNAKRQRTGGLTTTIYPAAPDFFQRYALDLSSFKASGAGKFQPDAPHVGFRFIMGDEWKGVEKPEIRLDNVHYAVPAFYVSAEGSDANDGRSERTAFATPQKAVNVAGPGDIIAVMNGTYRPVGIQEGIVRFQKPGAPSGWISLKNYPGHKPLFFAKGTWGAIRIWYTDAHAAADAAAGIVAPIPAYLEVRGLHIRGEGDVAREKYPDLVGKAAPETNANAISVGWRAQEGTPHHLRFADNLIEFCPGAGIGPGQADWVSIENNTVRNNCWTTIYATSGISLNHGTNFDGLGDPRRHTILIQGNTVSGNRTFVPWKQIGKISDGNGIIVDINQDAKLPEEKRHRGRTLIQNNLCFANGGSGIHTLKSKHVDIINNTVYGNAASPELVWGQLFVQLSDDVRIVNNIIVAPRDRPVNTVSMGGDDQNSTNILRAHNLYFGGAIAPKMGEGDVIADPQFINPSLDHTVADFHPKPGSPALRAGIGNGLAPPLDLAGKPRPLKAPDKGAYQH